MNVNRHTTGGTMYAQITLDGSAETLHAPTGEQLGMFEPAAPVSTFTAPAPEPMRGDEPMFEPIRAPHAGRRWS